MTFIDSNNEWNKIGSHKFFLKAKTYPRILFEVPFQKLYYYWQATHWSLIFKIGNFYVGWKLNFYTTLYWKLWQTNSLSFLLIIMFHNLIIFQQWLKPVHTNVFFFGLIIIFLAYNVFYAKWNQMDCVCKFIISLSPIIMKLNHCFVN